MAYLAAGIKLDTMDPLGLPLLALFVIGCSPSPGPDGGIGVTGAGSSASTTMPAGNESASTSEQPDAEPYGPCASDDDCPIFGAAMLAECTDREGVTPPLRRK